MKTILEFLLDHRRRTAILISSSLLGLNVVLVALYFASKAIVAIKEPLTELSNDKLVDTVLAVLSVPLLALCASIVGYYFGSKASEGDKEFSGEGSSLAREQRTISGWIPEAIRPIGNAALAIVVLLGHFLIAFVMFVLLHGIEVLVERLAAERNVRLFDLVPLRWFFDASELGIVVVFIALGVSDASKILYRSK